MVRLSLRGIELGRSAHNDWSPTRTSYHLLQSQCSDSYRHRFFLPMAKPLLSQFRFDGQHFHCLVVHQYSLRMSISPLLQSKLQQTNHLQPLQHTFLLPASALTHHFSLPSSEHLSRFYQTDPKRKQNLHY